MNQRNIFIALVAIIVIGVIGYFAFVILDSMSQAPYMMPEKKDATSDENQEVPEVPLGSSDPDCEKPYFISNSGQKIKSVNNAINVYENYLKINDDPSMDLRAFYKEYDKKPIIVQQAVKNEAGGIVMLDGYNMNLAHFIDFDGNIYAYRGCE